MTRTLYIKPNTVEVQDKFINKTDKDLGIMVDNFFTPDTNINHRYVCGIPVSVKNIDKVDISQISILELNDNGGVGMIAKDLIYRSNTDAYLRDSRGGLKKQALLFAPYETINFTRGLL